MGVRKFTISHTFLATQRNVSAFTQNLAPNAMLFLCRKVLGRGANGVQSPLVGITWPAGETEDEWVEDLPGVYRVYG